MKKEDAQECFQLLQKVILEAFQTEVLFYTPPYKDFSEIDQGIRNIMWSNFYNNDKSVLPSPTQPEWRLFVIRSNLGFYNIIVYLTFEEHPDFFSIGPFRSEDFSNEYFAKLIKEFQLPAELLSTLRTHYEGLPYVSLSAITNVTKQIISTFFPEFQTLSPVFVEFSEKKHKLQINTQMLHDLSAEYAEQYQSVLFDFLKSVIKGNIEQANDKLKNFLHISRFLYSQNIAEYKKNLYVLNDYCQTALLSTNVHPAHILKLHSSLRYKIDNLSNRDAILSMPNDICHKYCLLVKNYEFPEYSKTVRSVINYIYMHLDVNLSLALLAKYFDKNATSLSSTFSKEVGMSITAFIHQARINEAIRYFNTTKLSISEVSLAVGFQDFAYFSRLFHKEVGCSPREYCRKIR